MLALAVILVWLMLIMAGGLLIAIVLEPRTRAGEGYHAWKLERRAEVKREARAIQLDLRTRAGRVLEHVTRG